MWDTAANEQGKRTIYSFSLWKRGIGVLIEKHSDLITSHPLTDD
jgi:hypothetical protein